MDQELITYLDARFRSIDERFRETAQQIQGLREEMQEGFAKSNDEVHKARIQVEDLRDSVRLVAEATLGQRETLHSFRHDILRGLQNVRSSVTRPYEDLDQRLQAVERKVSGRDPMDIMREKLTEGSL